MEGIEKVIGIEGVEGLARLDAPLEDEMINDHVVSLPIAKKLKGCLPEGFESINVYTRSKRRSKPNSKFGNWYISKVEYQGLSEKHFIMENIPALLLSEMLALLPDKLIYDKNIDDYKCWFGMNKGVIGYANIPFTHRKYFAGINKDQNAATAAAQLYIELTKRGLIKKEGERC